MAEPKTEKSTSNAWAWPVGILIGLVIGIPSFGSTGGVAFGVALGIAFALAFGATGKRSEGGPSAGDTAEGDPSAGGTAGEGGSTAIPPKGSSIPDIADASATGDSADGPRRG
ncbi:hypothetical protein F8271_31660 [Micromonospora sp. ALFpr18c]|uniref:hypothetical protein n=1 Tax=unclassified Micromonospora TaxID=2617518 RepID=UPI00124B4332|nr:MULTISPECIES: hypothetical protein [unclassified Micromonospora]KAB1920164.1 hypothetical protein F8271_31660 [Micromonospora sp. ALFpr18c]MDG4759927.1 hypothetical protein [Micromonospora sp. WMMD710]